MDKEAQGKALLAAAREIRDEIIGYRRRIHATPELGYREHDTAALVAGSLREAGIEARTGWAREQTLRGVLSRLDIPFEEGMGGTGVVGELRGGAPGRTVALRADMDALPLGESEDPDHAPRRLGFASQRSGCMHACGHDAHSAMLLGAARLLARLRGGLRGSVRFIFQPAEESGNGAEALLKEGVLEGVDGVFGLHVWATLPAGKIAINPGPVLASSNVLKASFRGGGGHGSLPHEAGDPLLASCEFISSLYRSLRSRMDPRRPATVTVTRIEAGRTWNVIPSLSQMEGTFRVFDAGTREALLETVRRAGESAARFHDLEFRMSEVMVCPPTVNDEGLAALIRAETERTFGAQSVTTVEPLMGGEDFAYYLQEVPGVFLLLGTGPSDGSAVAPHHNPRFDVDEEVLPHGAALLATAALAFLGQ